MAETGTTFTITLVEPIPVEKVRDVAIALSKATGGDVARIESRLARGSTLARAETRERAEQVAATLRSVGLVVEILEPQSEFAWNAETDEAAEPASPTYAKPATATPSAKAPSNSALAGAIICLALAALVSFYAPFLLIVFGPLFIAAFALSIVAISQRNVGWGVVVLLASMIIGPVMTFGGFARVLAPIFSTPTPAQSPASNLSPRESLGATQSDAPAPLSALNEEVETSITGSTYLQYVDLYDLEAVRRTTGAVAVRFKLRNTGEQTVSRLEVSVYFRDSDDVVIFQDEFIPVIDDAFIWDRDVLRPNHIFQLAPDDFFLSLQVPSEWQPGNVIADISRIELE